MWRLLPCLWFAMGGYKLAERSLSGEAGYVGIGVAWIVLGTVTVVMNQVQLVWLFKRMETSRQGAVAVGGMSMAKDGDA